MIRGAGLAAGAAVVLGQPTWAAQTDPQRTKRENTAAQGTKQQQQTTATTSKEPTPIEDLSREHALGARLLLVYEASLGMPIGASTGATGTTGGQPQIKDVAGAAGLLRQVIEDFHVRLEEEHLFPIFQKANQMTDMIAILRQQHAAARNLTDAILKATSGTGVAANADTLRPHILAYVHMLRPHAAHEETILYPQLRTIASADQINELQQTFMENEKKMFGAGGFHGLVTKVAQLEQSLGINNLAMFTPKNVGGQTTTTATERQ